MGQYISSKASEKTYVAYIADLFLCSLFGPMLLFLSKELHSSHCCMHSINYVCDYCSSQMLFALLGKNPGLDLFI